MTYYTINPFLKTVPQKSWKNQFIPNINLNKNNY